MKIQVNCNLFLLLTPLLGFLFFIFSVILLVSVCVTWNLNSITYEEFIGLLKPSVLGLFIGIALCIFGSTYSQRNKKIETEINEKDKTPLLKMIDSYLSLFQDTNIDSQSKLILEVKNKKVRFLKKGIQIFTQHDMNKLEKDVFTILSHHMTKKEMDFFLSVGIKIPILTTTPSSHDKIKLQTLISTSF